jgi:hypothetical protein
MGAQGVGGMNRALHWASGIMLALGIGHLGLGIIIDRALVAGWLRDGLWATVPLLPDRTIDSLETTTAFWAGWGSFSVPLILLAGLIWHLAQQGIAVPSWVGWGIVVWTVIGGLMLVPSPFFLGAIPGALVVVAARRQQAGPGVPPGGPTAAHGAAVDTRRR